MGRKRKKDHKAVSLIGYHPADVAGTLRLLDQQIALADTIVKEERQSFVSLFYRKSVQVEQLQALLQEALDKENELSRSRMPS
ncbi:MAG: hypothetical protein K0Q59_1971 [Paenibacillus sp.]|nr:hypothetical protein [Paenibacillus sp.]